MGSSLGVFWVVTTIGVLLGVVSLIVGIASSDVVLIVLALVVLFVTIGTVPLVRWLARKAEGSQRRRRR